MMDYRTFMTLDFNLNGWLLDWLNRLYDRWRRRWRYDCDGFYHLLNLFLHFFYHLLSDIHVDVDRFGR